MLNMGTEDVGEGMSRKDNWGGGAVRVEDKWDVGERQRKRSRRTNSNETPTRSSIENEQGSGKPVRSPPEKNGDTFGEVRESNIREPTFRAARHPDFGA